MKKNYISSPESPFADKPKFKRLQEDPKITRFNDYRILFTLRISVMKLIMRQNQSNPPDADNLVTKTGSECTKPARSAGKHARASHDLFWLSLPLWLVGEVARSNPKQTQITLDQGEGEGGVRNKV